MKKLLSIVLCLILVVGCFPLTTLADGDTTIEGDGEASITLTTGVPELDSITVTPPTKTEYNVGEDLDTLMGLCDRLVVLCNGKVRGVVDPRKVSRNDIGLMMMDDGRGEKAV